MKRTTEFDIDRIEQFIKSDSDSPLFARLADEYLKIGLFDQAISICEAGLKKNRFYVTGYLVLAKLYIEKKRYLSAKKCLDIVFRLFPNCPAALYLMMEVNKNELTDQLPDTVTPQQEERKQVNVISEFYPVTAEKPENTKQEMDYNDFDLLIRKFEEAESLIIRANPDYVVKDTLIEEKENEIFTDMMYSIYYNQGIYDKALFILEGLIKKYPDKKEDYDKKMAEVKSKLFQ